MTGSPNWFAVTAVRSFESDTFSVPLPVLCSVTIRTPLPGATQSTAGAGPQPNRVVVVVLVVVVVVLTAAAQSGSPASTRPSPSLSRPTGSTSSGMPSSALEHGFFSLLTERPE